TITVLNTEKSPVTTAATITVGNGPTRPLLSPNGRILFVPNSEAATVSVIDTNSLSVRGAYAVERGPLNLALSSDAKTLVVPNSISGTVSVINLTTADLPFPPPAAKVKAKVKRATVSWAASNEAGVTGYVVTASPGGRTCSTAATTCTVRGLTPGKRYRFAVQAVNEFGTGAAVVSARVRIPK
ncbi:MAG: fibronectin type III domain-containing protein, partial [Candidatus Nanopelagicales bacterium]